MRKSRLHVVREGVAEHAKRNEVGEEDEERHHRVRHGGAPVIVDEFEHVTRRWDVVAIREWGRFAIRTWRTSYDVEHGGLAVH